MNQQSLELARAGLQGSIDGNFDVMRVLMEQRDALRAELEKTKCWSCYRLIGTSDEWPAGHGCKECKSQRATLDWIHRTT
jgi:hypothetical protein